MSDAPEDAPRKPGGPPVVRLRGIHKSFGSHHVLKGVNLDIPQGVTLALLGGSGGGKSVLMKHVIGLLQPDEGTVEVAGTDITNLPERKLKPVRQKVGMMFQNGALFDSMTVAQNVAFPLLEAGIRDETRLRRRVEEALDIVRLPGQMEKMPADLSGGMRKRVALARAVVERPEIVLYDEPHAGLDPVTADSIDHLIKHLQREHGMTNILVTHEMRSVFRVADHVVFMKDGQIYWQGAPEKLRSTSDPLLGDFIHGRSGEDWPE